MKDHKTFDIRGEIRTRNIPKYT